MSSMPEANAKELAFLKGATVQNVSVVYENVGGEDEEAVEIVFDLAEPTMVEGVLGSSVGIQIWTDPEGNGPGFAALMWVKEGV